MSIHISDQRLKGKWALGKSFVYIGIFITLKRMGWYFVQAVITNSICTFFNLEESINLGKFLKSDQFQSPRLTSVAIQFHSLIYKPLIGLIMTTAYDHQNFWCHATPVLWRRYTFFLILFERPFRRQPLLSSSKLVKRSVVANKIFPSDSNICASSIFREASFSENLSKGTFYTDRMIVADATPKCYFFFKNQKSHKEFSRLYLLQSNFTGCQCTTKAKCHLRNHCIGNVLQVHKV